MNDFLQGYAEEARDLIERAGQTLLALERTPNDQGALEELFRVMHTLKGGAGFVKETALTEPLHASEDLLDEFRGKIAFLTPAAVDLILATLDHVQACLGQMLQSGSAGHGARARGSALALDLRKLLVKHPNKAQGQSVSPPDTEAEEDMCDWSDTALAAAAAASGPTIALRYLPAPDCFFMELGDPLAIVLSAPGRLWFDVTAIDPWPACDADPPFDPYRCNLSFRLLSSATRGTLENHFRNSLDQVHFVAQCEASPEIDFGIWDDAPGAQMAPCCRLVASTDAETRALALELLTAQRATLCASASGEQWQGRVASVATVLAGIFYAAELTGLSARLGEATKDTTARRQPAEMTALIDEALEVLVSRGEPVRDALPIAPPLTPPQTSEPLIETARASLLIKVEQEQVDILMKLIGELIVAKNALPYLVRRAEQEYGDRRMARDLKGKYDALHRIVDELQNSVMRIRLVPVGQVFQRYHRLVRDLGRKLNKNIQLVVEGEDVRADKNIVEELAEPLVHLMRNACDHGLEEPSQRLMAGKPEKGTITLAARQIEDQVVIELRDDGRGVNFAKVKNKAVEMGLITLSVAEAMSDAEAARLILHPGFSTVEQVSDLSGRGVGMDVVHSMVKRTGGTLNVETALGKGTTVSISLPLSMAVSQVMMFDVDAGLYGVPLEQIVETVRASARSIHRLQRHEQILLRGRLIPLLRLRDVFRSSPPKEGPDDEFSVLVVRGGEGEVGLVVDNVRSEADVMVEPLDPALNRGGVFSGSAMLGDGSIMLMLNVRELV